MQEIATQLLKLIREKAVNWDIVIKTMDDFLQAYEVIEDKETNLEISDELKILLNREKINLKELMQFVVHECVEKAKQYLSSSLNKDFFACKDIGGQYDLLIRIKTLKAKLCDEWILFVDHDDDIDDLKNLYGRRMVFVVNNILGNITREYKALLLEVDFAIPLCLQPMEKITDEAYQSIFNFFEKFAKLKKYFSPDNPDQAVVKSFNNTSLVAIEMAGAYTDRAIAMVKYCLGLESNEIVVASGDSKSSDEEDKTQIGRTPKGKANIEVISQVKSLPQESIDKAILILKTLQIALTLDGDYFSKYHTDIESLVFSCQSIIFHVTEDSKDKKVWKESSETAEDLNSFVLSSSVDLQQHVNIYKWVMKYFQTKNILVQTYPLLSEFNAFVVFFKKFYQKLESVLAKYLPVALQVLAEIEAALKSKTNELSEDQKQLVSVVLPILETVVAIPVETLQRQFTDHSYQERLIDRVMNLRVTLNKSHIVLPPVRSTLYEDVPKDQFNKGKMQVFLSAMAGFQQEDSQDLEVLRFRIFEILAAYNDLMTFNIAFDPKIFDQIFSKISDCAKNAIQKIYDHLNEFESLQETVQEKPVVIFLVNHIKSLKAISEIMPGLKNLEITVKRSSVGSSEEKEKNLWEYDPKLAALKTGSNNLGNIVVELHGYHLERLESKAITRTNVAKDIEGEVRIKGRHVSYGTGVQFDDNTASSSSFSNIQANVYSEALKRIFLDIMSDEEKRDLISLYDFWFEQVTEIKGKVERDGLSNEKVFFPSKKLEGKRLETKRELSEVIIFVEQALDSKKSLVDKLKAEKAKEEHIKQVKQQAFDQFKEKIIYAYEMLNNLDGSMFEIESCVSQIIEVFDCIDRLYQLGEQTEKFKLIKEKKSNVPAESCDASEFVQNLLATFYSELLQKIQALDEKLKHDNYMEYLLEVFQKYQKLYENLNDFVQKPRYVKFIGKEYLSEGLKELGKKISNLQNELLIAKAATILNSDLSFFINHPNSIDLNKMLGQFTEAVGVLKTTENSNVESNVCEKIKTFYLHVQSALVVKISEVFEKPNKKTDFVQDDNSTKSIKELSLSLVILKKWFIEFSGESLSSKPEGFLTAICQILFNHAKSNEEVKNLEMCQALLKLLYEVCEGNLELSKQTVTIVTKVGSWLLIPDDKESKTVQEWKTYFDGLVSAPKIEELVAPKNNANVQEDLPFVNPSPVSQPSSSSGNGQAPKPSSSSNFVTDLFSKLTQ